jgi:hypothetical protein
MSAMNALQLPASVVERVAGIYSDRQRHLSWTQTDVLGMYFKWMRT